MTQQEKVFIPLPWNGERIEIGVISDTHDLVRPHAVEALARVDVILHAGDVCRPEVLAALSAIAPVHAVRGNNDRGIWADDLPVLALFQAGPHRLGMIHDLKELELDPQAAGLAAVISGHSHRPLLERRDGILFLNPGAAGPRRFRLPISVARLLAYEGGLEAQLVELTP